MTGLKGASFEETATVKLQMRTYWPSTDDEMRHIWGDSFEMPVTAIVKLFGYYKRDFGSISRKVTSNHARQQECIPICLSGSGVRQSDHQNKAAYL